MHFAFTEQQLEFQSALRSVLENECTPDHLRAAFADPSADAGRWTTLDEMGVVSLTVPEENGGLGLGLVDLVLLLEEAGRAALPEPLVETTAMAAPVLAALAGRHDRCQRALEALVGGGLKMAVSQSADPLVPVAGALGADAVLMTVVRDGIREIHLVPTHGDGPEVARPEPVSTLDPTRLVGRFTSDPTGSATSIATGDEAERLWGDLEQRAFVATGAFLLGLAERMITITVDYAKDRKQFGQPIGSFQAVKHLLAGAQVKLEFARPCVYAAAWMIDQGDPSAARNASTAKAYASEAATEAARVCLQAHGAIGYTWECDLQLYLKRSWALAEAWGSADDHRQLVLDSLVDEFG